MSQNSCTRRFVCTDLNNLSLYLTKSGDELYAVADKDMDIPKTKIVLAFGSGEWADKNEAREAMETTDAAGRWLSFVANPDTKVLAEKKHLPSPLDTLAEGVINKVVPLKDIFQAMQDLGEVAFTISHHDVTRDGTKYILTSKEPLVFILDRIKDDSKKEGKKKSKKATKKKGKAKKDTPSDDEALPPNHCNKASRDNSK